MITLIGANGSMGKRYQAILKYLFEEVECFDKNDGLPQVIASAAKSTGIIVASPTQTHFWYVSQLAFLKKPILCEKPLSRNLIELHEMINICHARGTSLNMTMQYSQLSQSKDPSKPSHYDYFRTGPDGLVWDCLQIIGLAKGKVYLDNKSPIWDCKINGQVLDLKAMDGAYLSFVAEWLKGRLRQNPDELIEMHKKTAEMAGEI